MFSIFKFLFVLVFSTNILFAQSIIDDFNTDDGIDSFTSELAEEKIVKISPSKRIFIITNDNGSFNKGDFISIIFEDKLVSRAIAAKLTNGIAGIKIVKIYSLTLWNKMAPGITVKILRGDDSYFLKSKDTNDQDLDEGKIQDQDDLFNDTLLDEDIDLKDNTKRLIKTDNIVAITYGSIDGVDQDGDSTTYLMLNGMWGYQMSDNIWGEVQYGQTIIRDFPNLEQDTTLSNFSLRLKYTVEAPFDSYLMPFVGYQSKNASSIQASTDEELNLLDLTKKTGPVFGVTVLKRLVPAWFIRADLGSDMISGGMALEF